MALPPTKVIARQVAIQINRMIDPLSAANLNNRILAL
jgi:hypothetical protein